MTDQEEVGKKYKCENCGEAEFDTAMQLRGHQMSCRPKTTEQQQAEAPKEVEVPRTVAGRGKKRVPFGVHQTRFADVSANDGYHYRVFNANWRKDPDRIERAKLAGYEVVDHHQSGGTVGTNDDGSEIKGILMRIPKELYEQDQAAKEAARTEIDAQIHKGKFLSKAGDGRYTPKEGVKIESKFTP